LDKQNVYDKELKKLNNIFANVEEDKRKLVEGLILDAAFLKSEGYELKNILKETGMININPNNKAIQRQVPAARQYLQNVNTYSTVIKSLSSVLDAKIEDDEDDLEEFE